ncbi:family 1 glycosylhydrolase [Agromyces bauzanensis]|uniref:Glycoside hydrolase family 1 n=1 Tax=Agromyces bauzanensis TaxID=1308924 RepID=A0A917UWF4_9MICO|nr:family 1 glycosylhydrolase [Agromyces bauzanensis]GGJ91764.1 glycoside hydrolase family 1 [Agromyces bauzanensis]
MPAQHWMNDGRLHFGVGVEDTFVPQERVGHRKLDEYELTQHYEHWREDLALAAESGAGFLRWGIPWYLVEPRPGEFDWRWIDDVAENTRTLGLRVVVDLMHYGTPLWLENQFLNASYPERVARYARAVAKRYAGVWNDFTPLNEPIINAIYCGETATWPPYLSGQDGFVKLTLALARGMVRTQQEIAAVNPAARFVHVDAGFRWEGDGGAIPLDVLEERRFLALDLITGRVDATHPLGSYLASHGVTEADLAWFAENAVTPDVVGINYYPAFTTVRYLDDGAAAPIEAGVAGLRDLLLLYWERYNLPLAVTETSRGGSVESRLEWLTESLAEVRALRAEGMPVLGYTWFPFFSLVDWLYRHDSKSPDEWFIHMGLVDLERGADRTLARRKTDAFGAFQRESGR